VLVAILFSIELALEFRHYRLGWETPILGQQVAALASEERKTKEKIYGPIDGFPFRSRIIEEEKAGKLRLWIASASHAEHSRLPVRKIFPNLLCQSIESEKNGCEVINGSKAGIGIDTNVAFVDEFASRYMPDYVLLYQSTQVIGGQQKSILEDGTGPEPAKGHGIFDFSKAKNLFQKTSAYQHLTDYIGGNIKLQGLLKTSLPSEMDDDFEEQVMKFINSSRSHGARPVLVTFAASHSSENIELLPRSIETSFVRYSSYLSADGWVYMIEHYNSLLRDIAVREKSPLIDLESELHGKHDFFVDYVHFSLEGHARVAEFVGLEMNKILEKEEI
jgi:hypothetical protein